MSEAVRAPTLLIGVGRYGDSVLTLLEADLAALRSAGEDAPAALLRSGARPDEEAWTTTLTELMRVRLGRAHARLDLVVVADLAEPEGAAGAMAACRALSGIIARAFPALFPPDAEVHQRKVQLVTLWATPTLAASEGGAAALRTVQELERWHREGPPSPLLARAYLVPRQNEWGALTDEDLVRASYLFSLASWFSGLRDEDPVRRRVEPPRDPEKLISAFNVAASSAPVEGILRYCSWRTALAGLELLEERVRSASTPQQLDRLRLSWRTWLSPFEEGEPASAARRLAEQGADRPGTARLFRWYDSNGNALLAVDRLLHPPSDSATAPPPEDADGLVGLDRQEWLQLEEIERELSGEVVARLPADEALEELAPLDRGLSELAVWLREQAPRPPLPELRVYREDPAPRNALKEELGRRPDLRDSVWPALLVGLLGGLLLSTWAVLRAAPPQTAGGSLGGLVVGGGAVASGIPAWQVWAWGVLGGLSSGGGWLGWRLRTVHRTLLGRVQAAEASQRGRGSAQRAMGESAIELRRHRLATGLLAAVEAWRERLAALRSVVVAERARAADEVRKLTREAAGEGADRPGTLGHTTPLHQLLVPLSLLDRIWETSRETREPAAWAGKLLGAAWPEAGLELDLPFGDEQTWLHRACRDQHAALLRSSVFDWPAASEAVHTQVGQFLGQVRLGLGVRPRDPHGQPLAANGIEELLVVAPQAGRHAVELALRTQQAPMEAIYSDAQPSRVVVLRTHDGFTAEELARGIRGLGGEAR